MPRIADPIMTAFSDKEPAAQGGTVSHLRGTARLAIDAVIGITDIVEDMHRNIAALSPIIGASPIGNAGGISGLVYASVRGITRIVGFGLDTAFAQIAPRLAFDLPWPGLQAITSAANGVLGDHLATSENPLAIRMQLRQGGEPLTIDAPAHASGAAPPGNKLLVLVHGLSMNDLQWEREGHDHGAAAARDLGYTPIYLFYNSGRHIFQNGQEFAELLECLLREWPHPISELAIMGHSMGGLVARSACHHASTVDHAWLRRLTKLVFLGTPHQGAPLERAGDLANTLLEFSPYTAPFAKLGNIRSAGIKDLSHGHITDQDRGKTTGLRRPNPLPEGVQCFAMAASRQAIDDGSRLAGDGLVPVESALGQHDDEMLALSLPPAHRCVVFGLNHFDLLSSRIAYDQIRTWLAGS